MHLQYISSQNALRILANTKAKKVAKERNVNVGLVEGL